MSEAVIPSEPSLEGLVAQVADEFLERQKRGESPKIEEYTNRYPESAALLRKVLAALELVGQPLPSGLVTRTAAEEPLPSALGDFRLGREIGRGGMGIVYEAEQLSLRRKVALKILPLAAVLDPRKLQRFKNEAQAAGNLHHPNIVPVYHVGCERGVHYYAMQYIEGQSLASIIGDLRENHQPGERVGVSPPSVDSAPTQDLRPTRGADATPLAAPAAETKPECGFDTRRSIHEQAFFQTVARLVEQAALALEYCHQVGIIHRDIKPANLLVDARGELWVTDFGLAHVQGDNGLTMTGDFIGTLRYVSPEQALGQRGLVDRRTDVYSLGATLYELLTLRPVFAAQEQRRLLQQIASEEPRPLRKWNAAVPVELQTIVSKALAKDPTERYESAQDLAEDLRHWLEDRPIRARRPTVPQRLRNWLRRHPAVVRSALLLAVLAYVGTVAGAWLLGREQQRTETARIEAALNDRKAKDVVQSGKETEELARTRAAETEAVLQFVQQRLITPAVPQSQAGDLGKDITHGAALHGTLPFIGHDLADWPRIEARLRMMLGGYFRVQGQAALAAEQFQRARALCTRHFGSNSPDTLWSTLRLANSYGALERRADAGRLYDEVLAQCKPGRGTEDTDTVRSFMAAARTFDLKDRLADALNFREEAVAALRAKLGPDHIDTLGSMLDLARCYNARGRYADALKLYVETLALCRAKLGPEHAYVLESMNGLAGTHIHLGQHADALPLYQETLALQIKLGADHRYVLATMDKVASGYTNLGRHADALRMHEESLALRKAKLGPDAAPTPMSMCRAAASLLVLERGAEAVPLFNESLQQPGILFVDPQLLHEVLNLLLPHFLKAKDAVACQAIAEKWEALRRTDAGKLYDAARLRAVAAAILRDDGAPKQADVEADRAMAWLKQAVAGGYRDTAHIARDAHLDAVRHRADFKLLMAELMANQAKEKTTALP